MVSEHKKSNPKMRQVILVVLGVVIVMLLALWANHRAKNTSGIDSFAECVAAGNPVQESYPETCTTKDGKHFTNPSQLL